MEDVFWFTRTWSVLVLNLEIPSGKLPSPLKTSADNAFYLFLYGYSPIYCLWTKLLLCNQFHVRIKICQNNILCLVLSTRCSCDVTNDPDKGSWDSVRKRLLTWQNVTYKRAVENFSLPPAGSSFQGSLFPHELLSSDNAEFALFDVIQNSGVQSPRDSSGWSQGSKKSLPSTCAGNLTSPPGTRCSPGALS